MNSIRKLTPEELAVYQRLAGYPDGLCIGVETSPKRLKLRALFDSLVKKKWATAEDTDDGPRYRAVLE